MTRLARLALRTYPPSFHERYGTELAGLVDDLPARRATAPDLLRGSALAWLRPSFAGPDARRARLQATAATTWIAWCAGFLVAPAMVRALLDPPTSGVSTAVRRWLDAATVLCAAGWVIALLGAAPVVVRHVLPALRQGEWSALRPMLPAVALAVAEVSGLAAIAAFRSGRGVHLSAASIVGGSLWLAGFALCVAAVGVGPVLSLRRLEVPTSTLRTTTLASVPVALLLTAATGCAITAAAQAGDARLFGSAVPVVVAMTVAAGASLVALTSASRGLRALT